MSIFIEEIRKFLEKEKISQNEFARRIDCDSGQFSGLLRKARPFPDDKIENIAPILEVSPEIIKGWILADKYPKNLLQKALQAKQQNPDAQPTIFRAKIDELRHAKNLNMENFAAAIGYNQGQLSQSSLGKKATSPLLIQQLSNYSGIPEDEIKSWVIADKYSLEALQTAVVQK